MNVQRFVRADINDTVSSLLGKMKRSGMHHAVVFDKDKYKGVISRRFLIGHRIDPSKMKVGNVIKHRSKSKIPFFVPTLTENMELSEVARLFASSSATILPVIRDKKVIGVVTAGDVVADIAPTYKGVATGELATMKLVTAKPTDTIDKVLTTMLQKNLHNMPVVDKTGCLGIVTLGDIIERFQLLNVNRRQRLSSAASHQGSAKKGYDAGEKTSGTNLPISNCMTRAPKMCCTEPDMSVPRAITKMNKQGVSSIVLMEEGTPVGIFTFKDLFKDYAKRR